MMCPLYPFHIVLLYLCLLLPLLLAVVQASDEVNIAFNPQNVTKLEQYNTTQVVLNCQPCPPEATKIRIKSNKPWIATPEHENAEVGAVEGEIVVDLSKDGVGSVGNWNVTFNVSGHFLGFAKFSGVAENDKGDVVASAPMDKDLDVSIRRKKTLSSKLFAYSVAVLISLAYINFGCAMDLQVVKETLRRPVGPVIGFVSQFVFMPLISFCLGYAFEDPAMRLGLFVTGTSPGGGASNIWTLMFGGNVNLSVTMTTISTFSAFFMMPLWLFTLGSVIFSDGDILIPYHKISVYAIMLVVPLCIGFLISRYLPRVSAFLVRILKPLALFMILFILIFGVYANFYMFKLMDWKVLLTGMGLPWLGFAFGCTFARLLKRPVEDITAIAIETGIQNTGVSIFILWFTLDRPLGDIAAVFPVAAAIMTPVPLLIALCFLKLREFIDKRKAPVQEMVEVGNGDIIKDQVKGSESSQKLLKGDTNGNV